MQHVSLSFSAAQHAKQIMQGYPEARLPARTNTECGVYLACGLGYYSALLVERGASVVFAYDISAPMVAGARAAFPSSAYPDLHFAVADCSDISKFPSHGELFDVVFAAWFLNYAGTETELTSMFRVIATNLAAGGRFIGITTNVADPCAKEDRKDFYGLDVEVMEKKYIAPDTGREVGVSARVTVRTETPFSFDVFMFRREVYERAAKLAGMGIRWREAIVPNDEREEEGYWSEWLKRPTFSVLEAVKL
ncbi:hypothetical protein N0V90_005242 [Kalmusia sp. IMI 367209]|nr:hypothetical protein N0V90_005242 [Kalmusia sp. IMI 367209]